MSEGDSGRWSLIVHGGAGRIRPSREGRKRDGLMAALAAGSAVLDSGGAAMAAAEAAVRSMEDDPVFNAGFGSVLNAAGEVETDAAIMAGATLDAGAVCALKGVKNPITVAARLMAEKTVMLAGEGAYAFARDNGGVLVDPRELIAPERADEAKDTVGCVVVDAAGDVVAATSTGGINRKPAGRVGDSPIVGAGLYAENGVGGVSFSGDGEAIIRLALAARMMATMGELDPHEAAAEAVRRLGAIGGDGGVIVLGAKGQPAFAHNSTQFAVGIAGAGRAPMAFLSRDEWDGL